jgi:hypothetical protein
LEASRFGSLGVRERMASNTQAVRPKRQPYFINRFLARAFMVFSVEFEASEAAERKLLGFSIFRYY